MHADGIHMILLYSFIVERIVLFVALLLFCFSTLVKKMIKESKKATRMYHNSSLIQFKKKLFDKDHGGYILVEI